MSITTTCPGCGATLSIDENQQSVTCQFCGNHFNVNLDETPPTLTKSAPRRNHVPLLLNHPPPAKPPRLCLGSCKTRPEMRCTIRPFPARGPHASADVYNPPLEDISSGSKPDLFPAPFSAVSRNLPVQPHHGQPPVGRDCHCGHGYFLCQLPVHGGHLSRLSAASSDENPGPVQGSPGR